MPLYCTVSYVPPAFDPYAAFRTPYHQKLLALFRAGAVLYRWRASPHLWQLESADGTQYLVDGDRESCEQLGVGRAQCDALLRLGRRSFDTVVGTRESRVERNVPQRECWLFHANTARLAEQNWAVLQTERAHRARACKEPAPDASKLSPLALSLWRTLKQVNGAMVRYPELSCSFAELDAQGLLVLTPEDKFELVPAMRQVPLPRGPLLKLTS